MDRMVGGAIVFLILFGGRFWCTVCPRPPLYEWLDHGAVIEKGNESPLSKAVRTTHRLKNIWLQNGAFQASPCSVQLFLTRPLRHRHCSRFVYCGAVILSKMYGRRVFCRYVCPVGGFIGLYSMVAPVGACVCAIHKYVYRTKRKNVFAAASRVTVVDGISGNLQRNAYCGLCTECLKTCSKDNIVVNLRPFGDDLFVDHHRLDEAYKAIIIVNLRRVLLGGLLGPWGF